MPRRAVHSLTSTPAGAWYAHRRASEQSDQNRLIETLGGAFGGYWGGRAPDILEPATSPCHRAFAHSVAAGVGVAGVGYSKLSRLQGFFRGEAAAFDERAAAVPPGSFEVLMWSMLAWLSRALAGLPAGYLVHPGLDAFTRRGITLA